jgi:hypothetical protein
LRFALDDERLYLIAVLWSKSLAVVATAAVSTASAATTPATSAATAAATTTASPLTAPSATAFALRASFVDDECAAEKILAVQGGDGLLSFCIIPNFGETKAARLTRETIAEERERIGLHADFRE